MSTVTADTDAAPIPDEARAVLWVRSLLYQSPPSGELVAVLEGAGVAPPQGRRWTVPVVAALETDLIRQGLLSPSRELPSARLHPTTVEAVAGPLGPALVQAVRALAESGGAGGDEAIRQLRLDIYTNDDAAFRQRLTGNLFLAALLSQFLGDWFADAPVTFDWLVGRAPLFRLGVFDVKLESFLLTGAADPELAAILAHVRAHQYDPGYAGIPHAILGWDILSGRLTEARRKLDTLVDFTGFLRPALAASIAFLSGDNVTATNQGRAALIRYRRFRGHENAFFLDYHGLFRLLTRLSVGNRKRFGELRTQIDGILKQSSSYRGGFKAIRALLDVAQGDAAAARSRLESLRRKMPTEPVSAALVGLAEFAVDPDLARRHQHDTAARFERLREVLPLVARIHAEVLAGSADDPTPYRAFLDAPGGDPVIAFTDIVRPRGGGSGG